MLRKAILWKGVSRGLGLAFTVGASACAALVGADFDVSLAPEGHGGSGVGATATTGTTTSSTIAPDAASRVDDDAGVDASALPDAGCATCPEVVVAGLNQPWGLAYHGGYVYVAEAGSAGGKSDGRVFRVPTAKPKTVEVIAEGQVQPCQLAVGAGYVFWSSNVSGTGAIWRAALGPAGEVLASGVVRFVEDQDAPIGVLVDETLNVQAPTLYWAMSDSVRSKPAGVMPAYASTSVVSQLSRPSVLGMLGGTLYVTVFDAGGVQAIAPSTTTMTTVASGLDHPNALVVDGAALFVAEYAPSGRIVRIDPSSPDVETPVVVASGQASPSGIAVDHGRVYWANFGAGMGQGTLQYADPPFGASSADPATVIASGQDFPVAVVVADGYLYWANDAVAPNGALMRQKLPPN